MADDQDRESKTEEATPKRVEDALKKGNTPSSREVGSVATLIAIGLGIPITMPRLAEQAGASLAVFLERPSEFAMENGQDVEAIVWLATGIAALAAWPVLLGLIAVGTLGAGLQNPPRLVLHRVKPDFSRISIGKGWERIAGARGRMEFLKAIVKIVLVCLAMYLALRGSPERILNSILMSYTEIPKVLAAEVGRLFVVTGVCLAAVALADVLWTRIKWRIDLRMSRQEIKDEHKLSEGDPIVRARQRSIARDRTRRRMVASVSRATLVVANPTHYAIAMQYVHGESAVPIVLAKGIDHLALRIREIAEQQGIPVVEDRALARSLYDAVKADRPIPPEFYRAIAEIILFLMSKRGTALETS